MSRLTQMVPQCVENGTPSRCSNYSSKMLLDVKGRLDATGHFRRCDTRDPPPPCVILQSHQVNRESLHSVHAMLSLGRLAGTRYLSKVPP